MPKRKRIPHGSSLLKRSIEFLDEWSKELNVLALSLHGTRDGTQLIKPARSDFPAFGPTYPSRYKGIFITSKMCVANIESKS